MSVRITPATAKARVCSACHTSCQRKEGRSSPREAKALKLSSGA
jgi:hypothetical protein